MKVRSCDFIELYSKLPGRVSKLSNLDENKLGEIDAQGKGKAGLRKVLLSPNYPLSKVVSGDLLCIPWGVRPNTWTPPFAPTGTGPAIWVDTPTGEQKLTWDGEKFVGATITIELVDDEWCMTGEVDHCFGVSTTFVCQEFPTGYSFLKTTGPNSYFEIINFDAEEDDKCRISHYTLTVERLDQRGVIVQE